MGWIRPRHHGRGPKHSLQIAAGRCQWNIVAYASPFAVASVLELFYAHGYRWWQALIITVSIGGLWGGMFCRQWRWRSKGTLVEIDVDGLLFLGGRRVPWADIAAVRRIRKNQWEGVVFVARPGVVLPLLQILLFTVRTPERRAQRLIKQWGSQLVLFPALLDTSADRIIDAVHVLGDGTAVHGGHRRHVTG
jgi:hypothetical protein